MVGMDGSAESKEALRWAIDLAATRGDEVVAVHAYPTLAMAYPYAYWGDAYVSTEDSDSLAERARGTLRDAVKEVVDAAGTEVKVIEEAVAGPPAQVLLDQGQTADLLVVGSRGLGGFRGMILGSVSHKVATHATCPVVVIPGHAKE